MCNSAILPEHRRHELYSLLLNLMINLVSEKGIQIIKSEHNATNNVVLIPKLKPGFVITALEINDKFGTLVKLKYFTNPTRRKLMDFRCGFQKPDEQLEKLMRR